MRVLITGKLESSSKLLILVGLLVACALIPGAAQGQSLVSISVAPANPSIPAGTGQQFTATGTYSDNSTQDLTTSVTWTSSSTATATITTAGFATGLAVGGTTIEATSGSISGSTGLTVTGSGLVGFWTFDDGSGTTALDSSGDSYTATLFNGVTWVTGQSGGAISANGVNQYVTTPAIDLSATSAVTVAMWLNRTYSTQDDVLLEASTNYTGSATGFGLFPDSSLCGGIEASVHGDVGYSVACYTQPSSGVWHHIAIVYDKTQPGTNAVNLYIDGLLQTPTGRPYTSNNTNTFGDNSIYLFARAGTQYFSSGAMDDLQLYNRALSATEIEEIYLAGNSQLLSLTVTPASASIATGATQQFTATGTYSNNSTQNLTSSVTWSSTNPSAATITSGGLATGVAAGSTTIQATSGSINGSTGLTVTAPTLVSIAVTPANPSIASGTTQQFTATGTYSDTSTQDLTSSVTWSSTNTAVATIASGGLATGVATGSTTIQATLGSISGSTSLTVTSVLVSITVTPANASIATGATQQYTATGLFSDNGTLNLTSSVTWTSSNPGAATITSGGLAAGVAAGSTTIQATLGGTSGNTGLTVTAPMLVSIAVTPANSSVVIGATPQYTATGTYSDSSTQNLTGSVTWSSTNTGVATIASGGLATGVATGSTTIQATSGSITGSTGLMVMPSVLVGWWTFDDGSGTTAADSSGNGLTASLVNGVSWVPGQIGGAISADGVDQYGTVPAINLSGTGTVTVAMWLNRTYSTVDDVLLEFSPNYNGSATGFGLFPDSSLCGGMEASVHGDAGYNVACYTQPSSGEWHHIAVVYDKTQAGSNAVNLYIDGVLQTATSRPFTSTNGNNFGNNPLYLFSRGGNQLFSAGEMDDLRLYSRALSVTEVQQLYQAGNSALVSIAVTPANGSIAKGATQQFTATGTYSNNSTQNLTSSVTWSSTNPSAATIMSGGLATGVAAGSTTIQATSGSISGSTGMTVTAPTLVSIAVTPANPSIASGTTQQFTATATYSDTSTQDLTSSVTWSSTNTAVATIASGGLATGVATGSTTIQATLGSISGSTSLTVTSVLVSITVTPANASIATGATQQYTATGLFSDNGTLNLTSSVTWTSSNPGAATITSGGLAAGVAAGSTTIQATLGGTSGNTGLTVTAPMLVSIAVTPANSSVVIGATPQYTATGTYSDSSTQNLTGSVTWSSTNTGVATIASGGLATGVATGSTTIQATSGSITGSTGLMVMPSALVGWWTFDDGSGTTAADSSGNGLTASLVNGVSWVPGQIGGAISADGVDQYGTVPAINLSGTGTVTVAMWLNRTYSTVDDVLLEFSPNYNGSATGFGLFPDSSLCGGMEASVHGDAGYNVACYTQPSSGEWHHIAVVYDKTQAGSNAVNLYIDGVLQTATSRPFTSTNGNNFGNNPLYLFSRGGNQLFSAGEMDDLRLYSRALSVTEVQQLYQAGNSALVSIAVTPANGSIAKGATQQFTATGTYSNNSTQNLTSSVTWSSTNPSAATIMSGGLATGVAAGSTTIQATSGSISGSTGMTVTAPTLVSIAVTPANPSIASGTTQQFTATATYSDTSTQDLTSSVTWSSTNTAVATIASGGLATGVATGSTTIQATLGSISGSTSLTVTSVLVSITVTPANASIATGATQQYTATGLFSDNGTLNLTSSVTWTSSNPGAATITSGGLAAGVAAGSTTIQATLGGTSGNTGLTVTAPMLVSIAVTPANSSVVIGATPQYTATGTYSDSSTQNLTGSVTWSSTNTGVATIASGGLATGVATGSTTIQATSGSITGSTGLMVMPSALVGWWTFDDGSGTTAADSSGNGLTASLVNGVSWVPGQIGGAISADGVDQYGTVPAINLSGTGTVTVAMWLNRTYSTVDDVLLEFSPNYNGSATGFGLFPDSSLCGGMEASVHGDAGYNVACYTQPSSGEWHHIAVVYDKTQAGSNAVNLYIDGVLQTATSRPFTSTNGNNFGNNPLYLFSRGGNQLFSAGEMDDLRLYSRALSVTEVQQLYQAGNSALVSIAVTPANGSIAKGATQQFTATGTYSNNSTQNLTSSVTWSSTNPSAATIMSGGLATGVAAGSTTIQATSGSISGSTGMTVTAPTLVSIAVTPANPSIASGTTQQFTATGTYSDTSTQDLTSSVTWSSTNTGAATITGGGLATGAGTGSTTIQATLGSITGSTGLTVTAPVLVSIAVTPANASIAAGTAQQFTATGTYSDGSTQNLTSTAIWSSSAPGVATISTPGLATAVGLGQTTIQAASGAINGSTTLAVTAGFVLAGSLNTGRSNDTATLLNNGLVLIAGGVDASGNASSSAELYNSATAAFTPTGSLNTGRSNDTATLLNDGLVLIAGGVDASGNASSSAELYNSATAAFTPTGSLNTGRSNDTATLLNDGLVLIVGGMDASGNPSTSAELYNPGAGTFTPTGNLNTGRSNGTATLLNDGTVLIAGGVDASGNPSTSAELYNPATGTFTPTGSLNTGRSNHTATLLNDGTVLIAGGVDASGNPSSSAELYNSTTAAFTPTGSLNTGRSNHTATLLNDGMVLVAGGNAQIGQLASTELFDPSTGAFTPAGSLNTGRSNHTATLLNDGMVLMAGGYGSSAVLSSAEMYEPANLTPPNLVSISLSPSSPTLALGTAQRLTATGTFSDSSTQQLASVTWGSSNTAVVSITDDASNLGTAYARAAGSATASACAGAVCGSTALTVGPPALVSIAIAPASPSVASGTTQQFTATGTYSDTSTQDLTSSVTWSSTNTGVATIASGGLATGVGAGTTTIQATSGSISGSTGLTVTAAVLASIAVTPINASIAKGTTQQFTATGTYSDNSTANLTSSVTWSSTNTGAATITGGGLATGAGTGSTTIQATSGSISGSTRLTVTAPTLVSIAVTPANASIASSGTQQFTATGTYSDTSTQDLTGSVTWGSTNTGVATIASGGLATGVAAGSTTIQATLGSISGSTGLTVTAPILVSITVTPANTSITTGASLQFTAMGIYGDGSSQNLTTVATWTSTNTAVATINSTGLATGVTAGSTTVQAAVGAVNGSTGLTITSPFPGITYDMWVGFEQCTSGSAPTTTCLANSTQGTAGAWDVSNMAGLITIQSAGQAPNPDGDTGTLGMAYNVANGGVGYVQWTLPSQQTSLSLGLWYKTSQPGSFTEGPHFITLFNTSYGNMEALSDDRSPQDNSRQITVLPFGVAVAGVADNTWYWCTMKWVEGGAGSFSVYDSSLNLVGTVNFTDTTNSAVQQILLGNTSGLSDPAQSGDTTYFDDLIVDYTNANFPLIPTKTAAASLVSIAVTPANPSSAKGTTQQFTATGTYSDNSMQNLTGSVMWSSSSTAVATITSGGLATGVGTGSTTIQATSGSISGSTGLTVTPAVLVSIAVAPVNSSIVINTTQQFTATGTYSDNSTQNLTGSVTWDSTNTAVATIASGGLATGVAPGTTTIQATSGSVSGSTSLTVTAILVSIAVTPASPSIAQGIMQQFTATGTYSDNSTQNLTGSVTWSSTNPGVATITSGGLATGVGTGSTTIQATSGAVSGSTGLTVTAAVLVSVVVTPANSSITTSATSQFTAMGIYSDGSSQNLTTVATWTSTNTAVATINSTGLATGVAVGNTTIQATAGASSGSTGLTVASPFPGITYDMWVDFEQCTSGSAPTATCLANSMHGTAGTWDVSNLGGLITIQTAAQAPKPSGDTGTLGMAYDLANGAAGFTQWNLPGTQGYSSLSFGLWYKTGQPGAFVEGPHFVTLFNSGYGDMIRLSDERSAHDNSRQIRVSPLDVAVGVNDNTWYWLTMKWVQGGAGSFSVYDASLNLVGSLTFTDDTNVPAQAILLGNTAGTPGQTGETTYFDDFIVDYTNANFPLIPMAPAAVSVSLNPTSVTNGSSSTGTVTLSAAAPAGGATVTLTSSNTAAATVPANVTVSGGATTANFTVNTSTVTFTTTVSISATYSNQTQSANLTVVPSVMAQVASDSFNRVNATTLGPNWTPLVGSTNVPLQIVSDQIESTATGPSIAKEMYYGGLNWTSDQYSAVQIVAATGNGYEGPAVRMTSNDTYYSCVVYSVGAGNASVGILLDNAGTFTVLASSTTATIAAGDTVGCTVQGASLTMTDQTTSATLLTASDSTIPSGYPGVVDSAGSGAVTNYVMANWAAGSSAAPLALGQLASDNFNRANALNLGPNWQVGYNHGPIQIVSDQLQPYPAGGNQPSKEHYIAYGTFPNDQWSQTQVVIEDTLGDNAVELRASGTVDTLYVCDVNLAGAAGTAETRIAEVLSGNIIPLVVDQQWSAVSPGDYIRAQVQGNLITLIDVTTGQLLVSVFNSDIASGYPGISLQAISGNPSDHIAANWSGGTFH